MKMVEKQDRHRTCDLLPDQKILFQLSYLLSMFCNNKCSILDGEKQGRSRTCDLQLRWMLFQLSYLLSESKYRLRLIKSKMKSKVGVEPTTLGLQSRCSSV
jgi:hypothetical protein